MEETLFERSFTSKLNWDYFLLRDWAWEDFTESSEKFKEMQENFDKSFLQPLIADGTWIELEEAKHYTKDETNIFVKHMYSKMCDIANNYAKEKFSILSCDKQEYEKLGLPIEEAPTFYVKSDLKRMYKDSIDFEISKDLIRDSLKEKYKEVFPKYFLKDFKVIESSLHQNNSFYQFGKTSNGGGYYQPHEKTLFKYNDEMYLLEDIDDNIGDFGRDESITLYKLIGITEENYKDFISYDKDSFGTTYIDTIESEKKQMASYYFNSMYNEDTYFNDFNELEEDMKMVLRNNKLLSENLVVELLQIGVDRNKTIEENKMEDVLSGNYENEFRTYSYNNGENSLVLELKTSNDYDYFLIDLVANNPENDLKYVYRVAMNVPDEVTFEFINELENRIEQKLVENQENMLDINEENPNYIIEQIDFVKNQIFQESLVEELKNFETSKGDIERDLGFDHTRNIYLANNYKLEDLIYNSTEKLLTSNHQGNYINTKDFLIDVRTGEENNVKIIKNIDNYKTINHYFNDYPFDNSRELVSYEIEIDRVSEEDERYRLKFTDELFRSSGDLNNKIFTEAKNIVKESNLTSTKELLSQVCSKGLSNKIEKFVRKMDKFAPKIPEKIDKQKIEFNKKRKTNSKDNTR